MVNISDRWNRDKTDDLQFAFFNGVGWESWENIWGIWNGITPRDSEATRRVATIERGVAPFLVSKEWEPYIPTHRTASLPASGRRENRPSGPSSIEMNTTLPGGRFRFLCQRDTLFRSLSRRRVDARARRWQTRACASPFEAHGYGAVLATQGDPTRRFVQLMREMKPMTAKPLASYSHEWKPLPQQLVEIPKSKAASTAPEGMVMISARRFRIQGGRNRD